MDFELTAEQRDLQATVRAFAEEVDRIDIGNDKVEQWFGNLDSAVAARVVFFNVMGSQNQNTRSMLMDAEDALVVAQWPSVVQYIDAISLIGQSRWVQRQADIDALLPAMGAVRTFITHWGRLAY